MDTPACSINAYAMSKCAFGYLGTGFRERVKLRKIQAVEEIS